MFRNLFVLAVAFVAAGAPRALSATPAPAAVARGAAISDPVIKGLPESATALSFQGETVAKEWPVYLSGAELRAVTSFRLTYSNTVSVSPEQSALTVSINGTTILTVPIEASSKPKSVVARIPVGLIEAGFNSVRVVVDQRHRVDCSAKATYELLTTLDGKETGFAGRLAGARSITSLEELADVPTDADGLTHIRLRPSGPTDQAEINALMRVAQAAILAGKFERPVVEVNAEPGTGPGLDVVVRGQSSPGEDQMIAQGGVDDLPNVLLTSGASADRHVLAVLAPSVEQLQATLHNLETFVAAIKHRGTVPGLLALGYRDGRAAPEGGKLRLADFGLDDEVFDGRLLKTSFRVALPADFFSAPYENVSFILDGAYGPGLARTARLDIRINNRAAVTMPLPYGNGETFSRQVMNVSVSYFHPGINDISIEADTSSRQDETCAYGATRGTPRFSLAASSEIAFPGLAHAAQLPELAATLAGGYPFGGSPATLPMHVSRSDPEYLDAAATIIANITATSGVAEPVEIRFDQPADDRGAGFIVAPLDELTGTIGAHMSALVTDPQSPAIATTGSPSADGDKLAASAAIPHAWNDKAIENEQFLVRSFDLAKASVVDWLGSRGFDFHRNVVGDPAPSLPADGLVIAQILRQPTDLNASLNRLLRSGAKLDLWTVVTATGGTDLNDELKKLVASRSWQELSGEAATYDSSNDTIHARKAQAVVYVATQPFTLQNARLVLGGILSSNLFAYAGLIIVGCLLLGGVTQFVLRQVGRGTDGSA
jgi:hypothetical protein